MNPDSNTIADYGLDLMHGDDTGNNPTRIDTEFNPPTEHGLPPELQIESDRQAKSNQTSERRTPQGQQSQGQQSQGQRHPTIQSSKGLEVLDVTLTDERFDIVYLAKTTGRSDKKIREILRTYRSIVPGDPTSLGQGELAHLKKALSDIGKGGKQISIAQSIEATVHVLETYQSQKILFAIPPAVAPAPTNPNPTNPSQANPSSQPTTNPTPTTPTKATIAIGQGGLPGSNEARLATLEAHLQALEVADQQRERQLTDLKDIVAALEPRMVRIEELDAALKADLRDDRRHTLDIGEKTNRTIRAIKEIKRKVRFGFAALDEAKIKLPTAAYDPSEPLEDGPNAPADPNAAKPVVPPQQSAEELNSLLETKKELHEAKEQNRLEAEKQQQAYTPIQPTPPASPQHSPQASQIQIVSTEET